MEILESLKNRKRQAEYELEIITIKKQNTKSSVSEAYNQQQLESHSSKEYTDISKAHLLMDEIESLENKIKTYTRDEIKKENQIFKYTYMSNGQQFQTQSKAIVAKYNAENRFFGMNKLYQTIFKINGQYKKFEQLSNKVDNQLNEQQQEKIVYELNKLFR